jgi:hypothetical protein
MKLHHYHLLVANMFLAASMDSKELKMLIAFIYIVISVLEMRREEDSKEGEQ